jgi:tripartite-type tricarboxylate transporter receptor subunit TctC
MLLAAVGTALPYIKSGKLKPIAVTGAQRFKGLPDVPTFSEEGIAGMDMAVTVGFSVPARTPDEVLTRLHKSLYEAVSSPEVFARLGDLGHVPLFADTNASIVMLNKDEQAAAKIIKNAGIKLD